jgi:hypothetical protein
LHGAVRLHGLTSSPTPETQVRVAWAAAEVVKTKIETIKIKIRRSDRKLFMFSFLLILVK